MSMLARIRTVLTMGRGVIKGLPGLTSADDPIAFFQRWFDDAKQSGILFPDAMTVATSTTDGAPSARTMLLKGVDDRGFVFYTNYNSRKSHELEKNSKAALVFHWPSLERQVRVEGAVTRIPKEESAAYFATRTRGSRIGAWASDQSSELESRAALEQRASEYENKFPGGDIPLPPFWGGFRLTPQSIEFWQGRLDRLHDRLRYQRTDGGWRVVRLSP